MADDYDIEQHFDLVSSWSKDPTAYLSRYYTLHFHWDKQQDLNREQVVYVRQAPNKVCIVGVTSEHAALKQQDVQVIPKLEAGANVKPETVLCDIVAGDTTYTVRAHMRGKLLEYNPRMTTPLLQEKTMTEGYLAVILPFHEDPTIQLKEFINHEEFNTI
ncbi:hypothetical protein K492DRAFT_176995 [Lichtheimia hyalospora FSU 10163]|nr:hypothetical protein K492DRAFT_176995 [Lichtheimia hyalospora FSU 10163]